MRTTCRQFHALTERFFFLEPMVDWGFTHRAWEKWASNNIGSSGEPLKAALLLNYDPSGPSRLMSVIAEQQGIKVKPVDLYPFLDFIRRNNLQTECFLIGQNECEYSRINASKNLLNGTTGWIHLVVKSQIHRQSLTRRLPALEEKGSLIPAYISSLYWPVGPLISYGRPLEPLSEIWPHQFMSTGFVQGV